MTEPKPEIELLHVSLDGIGYRSLRWQKGDILVVDGEAMIVARVEDDGTATGNAIWADTPPPMEVVERRRALRKRAQEMVAAVDRTVATPVSDLPSFF